jgi:hypothetical protein
MEVIVPTTIRLATDSDRQSNTSTSVAQLTTALGARHTSLHRRQRVNSFPSFPARDTGRALLRVAALGRDRARVHDGEKELVLSRRHSETLALLAHRPAGVSADQLALELYGERGRTDAARTEMHRLKRLFATHLQTNPYRVTAQVQFDLMAIEQLLRDGRVHAAVSKYRGPLLPRSLAPGVIDLRDELDGWLRRAVIAEEDVETLWAWLATSSGQDDILCWQRFIASIPHGDTRRTMAATRIGRLRRLYAPDANTIARHAA